mmetsp:Transcript_7517/g.22896  ORF Transcript_7517/g.22896 Transcript_7517/m.22896 type:complete len:275 (+) Transcript_7517:449-1273(+)
MRCSEPQAPPSGVNACVSSSSCAGWTSGSRFSASRATVSRSSPEPAAPPLARPTLMISTVESRGSCGRRTSAACRKSRSRGSLAMGSPFALATASRKRMTSAVENWHRVTAAASATHARTGEISSVFVPATARLMSPSAGILRASGAREASVAIPARSCFEALPLLARCAMHAARSPTSMTAAHLGSRARHCSSMRPVFRTVLTTRQASSVLLASRTSKALADVAFVTPATPAACAAPATATRCATEACLRCTEMRRRIASSRSAMPGSATRSA